MPPRCFVKVYGLTMIGFNAETIYSANAMLQGFAVQGREPSTSPKFWFGKCCRKGMVCWLRLRHLYCIMPNILKHHRKDER